MTMLANPFEATITIWHDWRYMPGHTDLQHCLTSKVTVGDEVLISRVRLSVASIWDVLDSAAYQAQLMIDGNGDHRYAMRAQKEHAARICANVHPMGGWICHEPEGHIGCHWHLGPGSEAW